RVSEAPAESEDAPALEIDLARIRAIRTESDEAARVLLDAIESAREHGELSDDEEDSDEGGVAGAEQGPIASETAGRFRGLRESLHPLLVDLMTSKEWTPNDFEDCARKHGSSGAAAFDEINAWADEILGDFVIEEG